MELEYTWATHHLGADWAAKYERDTFSPDEEALLTSLFSGWNLHGLGPYELATTED